METSSTNSGGISFAGMLTVLFIGLKLTGHIAWSWVWVLSPIWITLVTVLAILIFGLGVAMIADRKSRRDFF